MPRDGSGNYSVPGGTTATTGTTISSTAYNGFVNDIEADQNTARPISAGGTGAASASAARAGLDVPGKAATETISGDWAFTGSPDFSGVGNAGAILAALGLTGALMPFAMSTAPTGWLECDGSAVSRTTYAALFAAIGTTYGTGDGSTTFNLPDYRGEFIRGWDNGRGVDSGRAIGTAQADELEAHTHDVFVTNELTGTSVTAAARRVESSSSNADRVTGSTGGSETRPRNVAAMICIKT